VSQLDLMQLTVVAVLCSAAFAVVTEENVAVLDPSNFDEFIGAQSFTIWSSTRLGVDIASRSSQSGLQRPARHYS